MIGAVIGAVSALYTYGSGYQNAWPQPTEAERRRYRIKDKHRAMRERGLGRIVMSKFEDRVKARLWGLWWITMGTIGLAAAIGACTLAWKYLALAIAA